ncbi:hypothetical protein S83_000380 [Arachis hypogaea]
MPVQSFFLAVIYVQVLSIQHVLVRYMHLGILHPNTCVEFAPEDYILHVYVLIMVLIMINKRVKLETMKW